MKRSALAWSLAFGILLLIVGCGSPSAVEGKVKIESTDAFKRMGGTKSPPPKNPPP